MSERIEQIITNIEDSFNKLNTSVEQLQKAEYVASSSAATTSTLITEFRSTIDSIEKLIKVDFANEYNKLGKLNKELITKIERLDFDKGFNQLNQKIESKNFDEEFKSIFEFVSANNEILDSFQQIVIPAGFSNVITAIENKNFNSSFQSIEDKIRTKNFDSKFTSLEQKISEKNFDSNFQIIQERLGTLAGDCVLLKKLAYFVIVMLIIMCSMALFVFLAK